MQRLVVAHDAHGSPLRALRAWFHALASRPWQGAMYIARAAWFVDVIAIAAACVVLVPVAELPTAGTVGIFAVYLAARLVAEWARVPVGARSSLVMADAFVLLPLIVFPFGEAAAFIVVAAVLSNVVFASSWRASIAGCARDMFGYTVSFVGVHAVRTAMPFDDGYTLLLLVAAALSGPLVNDFLAYPLWHRVAFGSRDEDTVTWAEVLGAVVRTVVDAVMLVAGVIAYNEIPWLGAALVVPYLVVASALARRFEMSQELEASLDRLSRANIQFAAAMVGALDARDSYTAGHSAAVAVYARDMAQRLGFNDAVCRRAHLAGLLHDIGKIGVPGTILNKTGPLNPTEKELMQGHARGGAQILGQVDEFKDISVIIEHHHERYDGDGYPDGLSGTEIPLVSRMVAVADAYSAMTTHRPYHTPMQPREAMRMLDDGRGEQWDPEMVDTLLAVLADASDAYRRGTLADFGVEVAVHYALHGKDRPVLPVRREVPAAEVPEEHVDDERRAA